jgi:tetratricopeptide (TPR) repeat protein
MSRPRARAPTLAAARTLAGSVDLGELHRRGHAWVDGELGPALARLAASARAGDRRLAAHGHALLGDLHDLNGAPCAAVRAYHKSLELAPRVAHAWHAIGCMLDNMGRFREARHALRRALSLAPDNALLAGDLERVEWAMLHPGCPVLYEATSALWQASEALAAGKHREAHARVGRRRGVAARQLAARVHSAAGNPARALGEWEAIAALAGPIRLAHADWYYTFRGPVGDDPRLWRLMLWKIRQRLDGGAFVYSPTLAELDTPEPKRFELYVRYELARSEGNRAALLALAAKYPAWREPGEAVLRLS